MDEFELIRRYFGAAASGRGVAVGIGDDGAVLSPAPGKQQVVVIDTMVEGVHFPVDFNPVDIGYRAVAVNLSDIAAMGAAPRWMTLALSLPAANEPWLESFAEGLHTAAREFDVALVGGDTTYAEVRVISVQITAEIDEGRAILRSGAKPGDTVYVTGTIGDAAAGLHGLLRGQPVKKLVDRFARPAARVGYGQSLRGVASAAIDISDGLFGDLNKLASASGVGADIDLARLPYSDALAAHFSPDECRAFALAGGDDYELCFTSSKAPPDPGIMPLTAIGAISASNEVVCRFDGDIVPYDDAGYRHFR